MLGASTDLRPKFPEQKTLRDEFAMAALSAISYTNEDGHEGNIAKYAYQIADAMLNERNKGV